MTGMKHYVSYTVQMEAAEEGGFVVSVPSLPGCFTHGATYEEAVSRAGEAIMGYLEAMRKLGRPIPAETNLPPRLRVDVPLPALA
jgi:antitoxin HicB